MQDSLFTTDDRGASSQQRMVIPAKLPQRAASGMERGAGAELRRFEAEGVTLILGDCREELPQKADMVFTSPPYNMNLRIRGGEYCSRQIVDEFSTKYQGYADNLPLEEYERLNDDALSLCLRECPLVFWNVQFLTGNKRALFRLVGKYADTLKDVIVWDKLVAQPAMAEGVMNSRWEAVLVFDRDNAISRQFSNGFKRGTMDNLWTIQRSKSEDKSHGATFPVALPARAIHGFSKAGATVLDPFMGTGTTAIAAIRAGRKFVGIERDPNYFKVSVERVKRELAQGVLALSGGGAELAGDDDGESQSRASSHTVRLTD